MQLAPLPSCHLILGIMFAGITFLNYWLGITPSAHVTILAQIAQRIFGDSTIGNALFYIFQFICVTIDSCILHEERKIKMNNNKEFLATEPIGKLLLRLAIPTLAAQMINMLYNIIDRIISDIFQVSVPQH